MVNGGRRRATSLYSLADDLRSTVMTDMTIHFRPYVTPPTRLVLTPNPSMIRAQVPEAMSAPLIGHVDPAFLTIMDEWPHDTCASDSQECLSGPPGLSPGTLRHRGCLFQVGPALKAAGQIYAPPGPSA